VEEMNNPTMNYTKSSDMCKLYQFDEKMLQEMATLSGVSRTAVDAFFAGNPVERGEALILLSVLSAWTGHAWNLDTVSVSLKEEGQSEVARLLTQIEQDYIAAQNGMTGLAQGTARHSFITARMEHLGELHEELQKLAGEQAMPMIIRALDQLEAPNEQQCHSEEK
jgi:hypothetical protein